MSSNKIQGSEEFSGLVSKRDTECYPIGRSWMSRDILCYVSGAGERKVLVVGGFSGDETEISDLIRELIFGLESGQSDSGRIYGLNYKPLEERNKYFFIPSVNPDGMDIFLKGISAENPFFGRVRNILKGAETSSWKANIRGVTLSGNFNSQWVKGKLLERTKGIFGGAPAGYFGEYPESELESSSLASFCRKLSPSLVIELRRADSVSVLPCDDSDTSLGIFSEYTGIGIKKDFQSLYGSFALWAREELKCPSFVFRWDPSDGNGEMIKKAILLASAF